MFNSIYFETLTKIVRPSNVTFPAQTENGEWSQSKGAPATLTQQCRSEAAGTGATTPTADGKIVEYSWTVYLPVDSANFLFGEEVKLFNKEGLQKGAGTVKRFDRTLMHARLWV